MILIAENCLICFFCLFALKYSLQSSLKYVILNCVFMHSSTYHLCFNKKLIIKIQLKLVKIGIKSLSYITACDIMTNHFD